MYMSDYKNKLWTELSGFIGRVSYRNLKLGTVFSIQSHVRAVFIFVRTFPTIEQALIQFVVRKQLHFKITQICTLVEFHIMF